MVFAIFWGEMIQKRNDELSRIAERRQGLNVSFLLSVWWVLALSWLVCAALGVCDWLDWFGGGWSHAFKPSRLKKANFSYQLHELWVCVREWQLVWWIFRFLLIISMMLGHDKRFLRSSALRFMSSSFSMNCLKTLIPSDLWMLAPLNLALALFMVLNFVC